MTLQLGKPIDRRIPWIRALHDLDVARSAANGAPREKAVERSGKHVGDCLRSGPKVVAVRTLPTSDAPYPIRFAFSGAVPALAPGALLIMKNRSLLVQLFQLCGAPEQIQS